MKTELRRTVPHEVVIPLAGEDIADLFWSLDEKEQAAFFNRLGSKDWLVFQLQAVTDCGLLDYEGRNAMSRIGEYASAKP